MGNSDEGIHSGGVGVGVHSVIYMGGEGHPAEWWGQSITRRGIKKIGLHRGGVLPQLLHNEKHLYVH